MMQRILAFDVGDRRIGVAVSDALGITAQPVETYHRKGGAEKDAEYLLNLAKKYAPCNKHCRIGATIAAVWMEFTAVRP